MAKNRVHFFGPAFHKQREFRVGEYLPGACGWWYRGGLQATLTPRLVTCLSCIKKMRPHYPELNG